MNIATHFDLAQRDTVDRQSSIGEKVTLIGVAGVLGAVTVAWTGFLGWAAGWALGLW